MHEPFQGSITENASLNGNWGQTLDYKTDWKWEPTWKKKVRIEFPIFAKENRPEYKISEAINNIEEFAHFNDNFIWKTLQSMETKEWEESREPFIFLLNK